jgi:hypothetical protein
MSASFERETTASTAKSLFWSLLALGSGLVFMFLGLVAVTSSSTAAEGDRSSQALIASLRADLLNCQPGSVSVSKDQKVLKFRCQQPGQPVQEVTYRAISESNEILRQAGSESEKIARLEDLRFETGAGLLRARWTTGKMAWALGRWHGKGKS